MVTLNKTDYFIDLHAHILPGVDDGSRSMEETVLMLRAASLQNIGMIIATPHYRVGAKNTKKEQLFDIRNKVQEEADKYHIKLLMGNELYYSESIISALKSEEALTLAGSRYILVEFSINEAYDTIFRGMGELIRAGYAPILAHVERYVCLYKREDLVNDLVKSGCYIQMNSNSLMGGIFHTEAAFNRKLINQGLVHLIGSDCHDAKIRVPNMKDAVRVLQKKCDEGLLRIILMDNPLKILENTYI